MRLWKLFYSRLAVFFLSFLFSLLIVGLFAALIKNIPTILPEDTVKKVSEPVQVKPTVKTYPSPEYLINLITHSEPLVRRNIYKELFIRPSKNNVYYDYQRDLDYPERADNVKLDYLQLDKQDAEEAIINFTHLGTPTAIIMQKQQSEQWVVLDTLSALGQSIEDNPQEWLRAEALIESGVLELLVKEVISDNNTYTSQFKILKLINNKLIKVGELPEKEFLPYNKIESWPTVKCFTNNIYQVLHSPIPTIKLSTLKSTIKYTDSASEYKHWSDIDMCWHTAKRPWYNRPYTVSNEVLPTHTIFQWDSKQQYFVKK